MLLLLIQSSSLKKPGDKENLIIVSQPWDSNVILILLDKIAAVHVRLTFIYDGGLELES